MRWHFCKVFMVIDYQLKHNMKKCHFIMIGNQVVMCVIFAILGIDDIFMCIEKVYPKFLRNQL